MRPFNLWDVSDLLFLIENKCGETLEREYKQTISLNEASQRKELCKDVSAMANSQGGVIIFGLVETDREEMGSLPTDLSPIVDLSLKERMQQVILDGIQPRMEFRFYSIPSSEGNGEFVLLHIPKTLRGLHMVTLGKENRYFMRRDFQAVPMTPFEIEESYRIYSLMEQSAESRLARFETKMFPNVAGPDLWGAWISVIGIPIYPIPDLFVPMTLIDPIGLSDLYLGMHTSDGVMGTNHFHPSFDGLHASKTSEKRVVLFDHMIFRDGAVRLGICIGPRKDKGVPALIVLESFHNCISYLVGLFSKAGYSAGMRLECAITLNSFYKLNVPEPLEELQTNWMERPSNAIQFNHSLQFDSQSWLNDASKILEPLMHHLFQSFGYIRCSYYNGDSGNYNERVLTHFKWVS